MDHIYTIIDHKHKFFKYNLFQPNFVKHFSIIEKNYVQKRLGLFLVKIHFLQNN